MKQESRRAVKHNHTAVSGHKHGFRNKASTAFPAGQVFPLQNKQRDLFPLGMFRALARSKGTSDKVLLAQNRTLR